MRIWVAGVSALVILGKIIWVAFFDLVILGKKIWVAFFEFLFSLGEEMVCIFDQYLT
jgi:hypothetical protein